MRTRSRSLTPFGMTAFLGMTTLFGTTALLWMTALRDRKKRDMP